MNYEHFDTIKYKKTVRTDWNVRSNSYHTDWVQQQLGPFNATSKLIRKLEINPNDSILDVACGTGIVLSEAAKYLSSKARMVGIDISRTALSIAKLWECFQNVSLIEMDAEKLGFICEFNKIACQFALTLFPNPQRTLRSLKSIMSKNGKIGIVVHGRMEDVPYFNSILSPMSKFVKDTEFTGYPSLFRFGDERELERVIANAGFSNVIVNSYTFYYSASSFEDYWTNFFSSGYSNALRPLVFNGNKTLLLSIKAKAKSLVSKYINVDQILFPWKVLIAIGTE